MSLKQALTEQKELNEQSVPQISGLLGIPLDGTKRVEVPNRNAYVYVRLRNNTSEVIQAFNNQVSPSYNLPVLVERQGNRYVVVSVDTQRYDNNWASFSPFLPRHGNTHSFDLESGGGGDVVWVHSRQFMPLLALPSGSSGGPNVVIAPYTLKNQDGTWRYIGNTGTQNLTFYNPSSPTGAIMALVYVDATTGNPGVLFGTGTVFLNSLTGTSQVYPYIPASANPNWIPDVAVRLVTGTSVITWDNMYDVRQWLHITPTGSAGGAGISSVNIQDEGAPAGTATTFNFVGDNVHASVSGTVVRVFVTGTAGAPGPAGTGTTFSGDPLSAVLTNATGALFTPAWLKWGTATNEYLEFGADEVGKEANAGRIGYNVFNNGYFDMVGAGTGTSARWWRFFDHVKVEEDLVVGGAVTGTTFSATNSIYSPAINIASGSVYNAGGVPHTHTYIPTNGWVQVSEVWNRTSNHAFNVASNVTGTYRNGTKIKYNEGGGDEFGAVHKSVLTGTTTFVALITNTNFTMASSPADRYVSHIDLPEGFPEQFDWTPVHSRGTTNYVNFPTVTFAKWIVNGTRLKFREQHQIASIPSGTGFQKFTLPITPDAAAEISRMTGNGMQLNSAYGLLVFITENEGCRVFKYDGTAEALASQFYFVNGEFDL